MEVIRTSLIALALTSAAQGETLPPIQTVFVILLENQNWSSIEGSTNAPFINGILLPRASYCRQYYNPPGLHPSLPNYLWLEAGTNFSIYDNNAPASDHQSTTNHLVTLLNNAGISWRVYEEDIMAGYVPLTDTNNYAVRHNPFVYFDDVTGTNNPNYTYGILHIRPYDELAADLTNNTVARYNFITPDLCDDGHNTCAPQNDPIQQADDWLAGEVPKILDSAAYSNHGALFITWDEGEGSDGPIGMILLSPLARGGGYGSNLYYTHSSLLRTIQEIFSVSPWLGDAANATDLSDLFLQLDITSAGMDANGAFGLNVTGVLPGSTNFVEASDNLAAWSVIATNYCFSNSFSVTDNTATNHHWRFYRVRQAP